MESETEAVVVSRKTKVCSSDGAKLALNPTIGVTTKTAARKNFIV